MARTGISRATLNNYIGLNLIPPPTVRKPEEIGGPTKIGYFPEWVVNRIDRIRQRRLSCNSWMKKEKFCQLRLNRNLT
jgi:hypothetical protein